MTATPPAGWSLDPAREQEIRELYAEFGASTSIAAVGPYSALDDLLAEITRLRDELGRLQSRVTVLADRWDGEPATDPRHARAIRAALFLAARTPTS